MTHFLVDSYIYIMFKSYALALYKYTLVLHQDIYIQNKHTEKNCS